MFACNKEGDERWMAGDISRRKMINEKRHIDQENDARRICDTKFDQTALSWLNTHEHQQREVEINYVAGRTGDISTGKDGVG